MERLWKILFCLFQVKRESTSVHFMYYPWSTIYYIITNTNFPPNISPPKSKVKSELQVQLLNLSKIGIYVDSNKIKRY